jgi:hypothetical protein
MQQDIVPWPLLQWRVPEFLAGTLLESPLAGLALTMLVPLTILL